MNLDLQMSQLRMFEIFHGVIKITSENESLFLLKRLLVGLFVVDLTDIHSLVVKTFLGVLHPNKLNFNHLVRSLQILSGMGLFCVVQPSPVYGSRSWEHRAWRTVIIVMSLGRSFWVYTQALKCDTPDIAVIVKIWKYLLMWIKSLFLSHSQPLNKFQRWERIALENILVYTENFAFCPSWVGLPCSSQVTTSKAIETTHLFVELESDAVAVFCFLSFPLDGKVLF